MKKHVFLLFSVLIISQSLFSQIPKYPLTTRSTSLGFSWVNILDNYLSPLPYDGIALNVSTEWYRLFNPNNQYISYKHRFDIQLGNTVNNPSTASILFIGLNYDWGAFYHIPIFDGFQIRAGGYADIDFLFKYNSRNVNNPVNFDLALSINAALMLIYDFEAADRVFRVQGELDSPVIGVMYAPELGASYYEIFSLGAKGTYVHFSSFHNKIALRHRYFIEVPMKRATWRFGFALEHNKYSANDMIFKKNDIGFYIGYTQTFFNFTLKNPPPSYQYINF